MTKSLRKALSASALCSLLLLTACGGRDVVAPPTAPVSPTGQASATSTPSPVASASPSPEASSPTPTSSPAAQETTQAPSPTAETSSEQAAPSPEVTPAEPLAQAGTNCGPSNTGRTTLVLAEGSASCAEVQQVFADFNIKFNESTNSISISGYQCNSHSPESTQATGRTVTCVNSTNRLEAMTNYPLGGSPISANDSRFTKITEYGTEIYYFQANGIFCEIGYDRMFGCHRESVINEMFDAETIHWGDGSQLLVSSIPEYGRITEANRAFPALPAGSTITTGQFACTNDGTYLKCTNGVKTFAANATEFTEL